MSLTGIFGKPVDNLKTLVANVTAFQTFTGTADAAAAAARINQVIQSATSKTWPLAIIEIDNPSFERDANGAGVNAYSYAFLLKLFFEDQKADTPANIETFVNSIGSVVSGMFDLSGTSDYMYIERLAGVGPTFFADDEDSTPILRAVFSVEGGF